MSLTGRPSRQASHGTARHDPRMACRGRSDCRVPGCGRRLDSASPTGWRGHRVAAATVSILLRVSEIVGRPLVTLGGDDLAQVRDVVFEGAYGGIEGFTLAKRSTFGGPINSVLPWSAVVALGPDAVMVADAEALSTEPLAPSSSSEGDVLGDRVVTDEGVELGHVFAMSSSRSPMPERRSSAVRWNRPPPSNPLTGVKVGDSIFRGPGRSRHRGMRSSCRLPRSSM